MPVLNANTVDFLSSSPTQTQRLGARIGELLQPGDLVCLHGDLGAGKTTLVQGIARGWGAERAAKSPTFVLVHEYGRADGAFLFHVDAYRLAPGEGNGLELETALERGAMVVEWPERLGNALPAGGLQIELRWVDETRRNLRIWAEGARPTELVQAFRELAFGG